jgi:pimeloyl-ACP methyl ester carboxylesterase
MNFFTAYKAVGAGVDVPTYFIESTAPNNVDDTDRISTDPLPDLQLIADSDDAVRQIAGDLAKGDDPNLVVMVHGFNNPKVDVLKTYTAAALAVNRDQAIQRRNGLVCLGYRWPSEKIGQPWRGTWDALPTLPTWILYLGAALAVAPFLLYFLAYGMPDIFRLARNLVADHIVTLIGLTLAGLVLTAALLRVIVYFRDNYRASNFGIPDLIQIIRAIDREVVELRRGLGEGDAHHRKVQLSFIGHSMGGFVVTNTIRTLSDVFVTPVESLNAFGAAGPTPHPDMQAIGNVFKLKRFVLVSPDIPAEALLSNRGNFLASSLSRFEEAYLFSNEGDEVLRQISTLANYFVFPTKNRNHGFRLGNVEILSSNFGLIDPAAAGGFLGTLRIGNLTVQQLYQALDSAEASRQPNEQRRVRAQASLPEVFTFFDCTDYVDADASGASRPLLTFAIWRKRHDKFARMRFYSHLRLLLAYLLPGHRPNVHGGYFEGVLSQQLIYRLACLGFEETVAAFGSQAALAAACGSKQIRVLLSPCLRKAGTGPAAALVRSG